MMFMVPTDDTFVIFWVDVFPADRHLQQTCIISKVVRVEGTFVDISLHHAQHNKSQVIGLNLVEL